MKKKHKTKLSKSHSSSLWEVCLPFNKLENVTIYSELQYRGKISWSRKLVAISNGQLISYKPGKHSRPVMAIPLIGYDATYFKRDLLKGYEIKMTHPNAISHHFAVDSANWAQRWCEVSASIVLCMNDEAFIVKNLIFISIILALTMQLTLFC